MITSDTIIFNECINDSACTHLYHSAAADVWQAFGISAFLLERIASEHGMDRIVDQSIHFQTPHTFFHMEEMHKKAEHLSKYAMYDIAGSDLHTPVQCELLNKIQVHSLITPIIK